HDAEHRNTRPLLQMVEHQVWRDRRDQRKIGARACEGFDFGREKIDNRPQLIAREPVHQLLVIDTVNNHWWRTTFRIARLVSRNQPPVILDRRFRPRPTNHSKYPHTNTCTRASTLRYLLEAKFLKSSAAPRALKRD